VYCGAGFSSKWATELDIKFDQVPQHRLQQMKQDIFERAEQLKHVYMAGGEPLLMKENLELLKELNPDVNLRINTNLSKVDTGVFDAICQFKNVHWTVSVETIEAEFEYIRFGGRWVDFLDNLNTIRQLDHKISFNMLHLVLNHLSIFDCIDYLKYLGFHNNSFVAGPLLTPKYLNILNLPEAAIDEVRTALKLRLGQKPGYLLENSYQNMLAYLDQPFDKDLSNTFKQIEIMDQRRGLDSKKIFKDLYRYE
jgi:MoaA/NifB/PqqE/SkfB family radical SAM enzyme